jgi:hypothetical protein
MTYSPISSISFADSPSLDAFRRLRVSNPTMLIDEKSVTASPIVGNAASGGGSFSKPANRASFYLTTGGVGSLARRQTRQRAVYQPQKSQHISATFTLGTLTAGIVQRVGYFDDSNGLFFEANGTSLGFVVRSSTSGSPVDVVIDRAQWSDKLDGTGPSGVTFDPTKSQILDIDFQWLGVGRVRFGFVIGGLAVSCTSSYHSNVLAGVYMANPNLPVRWEILGQSSAAVVTMEAICAAVTSEGGFDGRGITIAHDNDGVAKSIGAAAFGEVLAVRMTSTGVLVGISFPEQFTVLCSTTANFLWEVWLNATGMSGGAWSAPAAALTEQNTTRTGTYTGGVKLASGYVSTNISQALASLPLAAGLGYDINTASADILSLRVYNLTGTNSYYSSFIVRQEA